MIGTAITVWHAGRFGRATIIEARFDAAEAWWYEIAPDETYMIQGQGFARPDKEGIVWARGWDAETLGALRAARALAGLPT